MPNYIIYFLFIIFLLLAIYFAFLWWKKSKKISQDKLKNFQKKLKQISLSTSSKEIIIDADKLYHKILEEIWYSWDFWEILKQKPPIITNLDKIWELHKIRNKLVHDFYNYDEKFLLTKRNEFLKELEKLLNKLR